MVCWEGKGQKRDSYASAKGKTPQADAVYQQRVGATDLSSIRLSREMVYKYQIVKASACKKLLEYP